MRLVIPNSDIEGPAALECSPIRPLPVDLTGWQRRVLAPRDPCQRVHVRETAQTETASGWPVTLVRSDVVDGDGAVIACQLHGFYQLIDRGCVVAVSGAEAAAVEARRGDLLVAEVDWRSDELVALSQLWETGS